MERGGGGDREKGGTTKGANDGEGRVWERGGMSDGEEGMGRCWRGTRVSDIEGDGASDGEG